MKKIYTAILIVAMNLVIHAHEPLASSLQSHTQPQAAIPIEENLTPLEKEASELAKKLPTFPPKEQINKIIAFMKQHKKEMSLKEKIQISALFAIVTALGATIVYKAFKSLLSKKST